MLKHNGMQTQFGGWSFPDNELRDHIAGLASCRRSANARIPAVRMMGGGPRTYPGGVGKWQWKRQQRKDERELEKQRLWRERKILRTRRRQELREASPGGFATLDGPVNSSAASEVMLVPRHHRHASVLGLGSLYEEIGLNNSTTVVEVVGNATEGRQVTETVQGGWTGSRKEVAEQIQKVRDRFSNRYRWLAESSNSATGSSFAKLSLSHLSLKALKFILNIQNMTPVQEATLPIILQGNDASVPDLRVTAVNIDGVQMGGDILAMTSVAGEDITSSVICAIEVILRSSQELPVSEIARLQLRLTVSGRYPVNAVLVCPTQESSILVASEAKLMLMFHSGIRVQVLKGGNDIREETRCLQKSPCQIVVATPGRLLDHLHRSPEFRGQLCDLKLFVLFQVQKLLDMGYQRTLERISQFMSRTRQTLLWSPTQSDEVRALAKILLKESHNVINSCGDEEYEVAWSMIRQVFLIVPIEQHLALIYSLLKTHAEQERNYKVVVFCQTVRTATFLSETFKNLGFHTCQVHMRMNEKRRERTAAMFRTTKDGVILFTCGASGWGVSNPDVTLILQIGQPSGREQYVQRVTLSGQKTKERDCILFLMSHEQQCLSELSAFPICELPWPEINSDIEAKVQQAVQQVNSLVRMKAYVAWLRYHITRAPTAFGKQEAVRLANVYGTVLGFLRMPRLNARTAKLLGLEEIDPSLL